MVLQKLGIIFPIVQAPMAGVSTPKLAASVSNAGGLGMLGIGSSKANNARKMILETRKLTQRPFGVNVFCHNPPIRDPIREEQWLRYLNPLFESLGTKRPAGMEEPYKSFLQDRTMLETLLELRPDVVTFHFGVPPPDTVRMLREVGIYTMGTATNIQEALVVQKFGIDSIVAQGIEAGGHRGKFDPNVKDEQWSTMVLVRMLAQEMKIPIVAAGGIMDGHISKAMMNVGASAVQLGTAYILCPESGANDGYREDLKSARNQSTQCTSAFSGRPARSITNDFIRYCSTLDTPPTAAYPLAYDVSKRLHAAEPKGQYKYAPHWAGQGAPLAREMGAGDLTKLIAQEMGF